jgi:4-hydroxybenzoate polyprenyltransferase
MDQKMTSATEIPLVVDLDGTLVKVDTLHESFVELASKSPLKAMRALLAIRHGRASFKSAVADHVVFQTATVPVDESVVEVINQARKDGRKVYLATAADRRFADAIAASNCEFDGVLASEGGLNLKGKAKADRLVALFGLHGFDYIGNSSEDLPVWQAANTPLITGGGRQLTERLRREFPNAVVLGEKNFSIRPYIRTLRPHQWLKNILVALPAVAGHDFSFSGLVTVVTAIVSFSFAASSIYIINDMLDLPHDRVHPQKRYRPIAAGAVPVSRAIILFAVVAALSVATALTLPPAFMAVLIFYFALSMTYSVYLKRKLMIDVVALAALYGVRVLAGGEATGIPLSQWLVGFCFFLFLSLALVKRTTEMMLLPQDSVDKIKGRGYRRADLPTITSLTAASGFVAVLVLALYINSPEVRSLYHHPEWLWGVGMILTYWLGRVCLLTGRGEMNQDPIIFAATDHISLLAGVVIVGIFVIAL